MAKNKKTAGGELDETKEMARRIIEHHFGAKPRRVEHQGSGLSNFVFLVHHAEGDFVVRISPDPTRINAFIKEQWAVTKAHEAGVPTAEILEVGNSVIPHPYMVARRVQGRDATMHPERVAILREMGRYAALINSISTTGFGSVFDWSSNQLSRNDTWKEYLHGELRLDARLEILRKQRMLSAPKLKTLRSTLERAAKRSTKPALNHGDIRLKNVMVDDAGKITALIDWEHCVSHLAPQWELSLALHDLSIDEKQEFLTGYGLPPKQFAAMAPVIKALNVINYAPHIERLVELDDRVELDHFRVRLSGALDLYSW
jgi:aminoglycoside phosphotransferase (APT) family kinase protein